MASTSWGGEGVYKALIASSPEAVLTVSPKGRIKTANPAAHRLLGCPDGDLVGTAASDHAETLAVLNHVMPGLADVDHRVGDVTVMVTTVAVEPAGTTAVFVRDISELAHQATHDDLTGLANRATLVTELERAAARAERNAMGHGLLFIDLDRFKAINDTFGHSVGDLVLREVSRRLNIATRDVDLVARNGGDEFVVLAEEAPDITTLVRLAERIQKALAKPVLLENDELPVSASIGVAWLAPGAGDGRNQLRDADVAMYQAKASGPGQIRVFDTTMRRWVEQRFELERQLRRAVGAGQLQAFVQPVVSLRTGRVTGGELLCRWTTEDGREIPPEAFIEVAEDSALVVDIGRWMLDQAASLMMAMGDDALSLSVNISGRHIDHPAIVEDIESVLERWPIDPARLIIEITETSLLRDLDEAAISLGQIRDLGVSICVDDFGVGYASLRYLRELPVALVKIDRSITAGVGRNESDTVIVTMLTRLADVLQIEIVAEGVETETQREDLGDMGVDFAQGYLFARAMPLADFIGWVASWRAEHTHPSANAGVLGRRSPSTGPTPIESPTIIQL